MQDNNNIGFILEYEEILLGKRSDFSSLYVKKGSSEKDVAVIIRYAFHSLLGWTPEQMYEYINDKLINVLRLGRMIKKIQFPAGLDKKEDLYYLAGIAYPKSINTTNKKIMLDIYLKVLSGKLNKFPKNYFLRNGSEESAAFCLRYAIDKFSDAYDIPELYMKFADPEWTRSFLTKSRLDVVCNDMYEYPIDMLHYSLLDEEQSDLYYNFGHFKTEWQKYNTKSSSRKVKKKKEDKTIA